MRNIGYLMMAAVAASAFAAAPTFAAGGVAMNGGGNAMTATGSVLSPNSQSTIPYPGGGWGGGYGYWGYQGTTIAGSYARGLAAVIRAKGDYNMATSAAAVNWSVARGREIENDRLWVKTYFDLREMNRAYRLAEIKRQRGNPADFARYAQAGRPKLLSNRQLDAVTGQIRWPILLTAAGFDQQRAALEKIFTARAYRGVLGADDFISAVRTIDKMSVQLADNITNVPPQAYVDARSFLRSLAYEARMPAG
jgi:hypothetical protein